MDPYSPIAAPAPRPLTSPTLRRLGLVVRALVLLGALVLACVPLWLWLSPEQLRAEAVSTLRLDGKPLTIDERALWLHAAVGLPGLALGYFLLWQLWQLFGEYAQGRVFSLAAVLRLRRFAVGVLVLGLWTPVARMGSVLALTWGNPPGQRYLMLGLSTDDYVRVLLGAVLLAIAAVMAEAARLAEENAEFV